MLEAIGYGGGRYFPIRIGIGQLLLLYQRWRTSCISEATHKAFGADIPDIYAVLASI